MALITDIALFVFLACFLSGLLITAVSGSARAVKIYLATLCGLAIIGLIIALFASGGLFIFLLFQVISLMLILFAIIIVGAATGGGIYTLIHRQSSFKSLAEDELDNYLSLSEFCSKENISEERTRARIKSGFYKGGKYKGDIVIHKLELSTQKDKENSSA